MDFAFGISASFVVLTRRKSAAAHNNVLSTFDQVTNVFQTFKCSYILLCIGDL